jgi:hypothetical protein
VKRVNILCEIRDFNGGVADVTDVSSVMGSVVVVLLGE